VIQRKDCLPLPRGDSGFPLAQAIGQQPQGAIQTDAVIDALHRARGLAATVRGAQLQQAFNWAS